MFARSWVRYSLCPMLMTCLIFHLSSLLLLSDSTFSRLANNQCCLHDTGKGKVCIRAKWPIRPVLIPGFRSMKRLGVFLLPPGWDASRRVTPSSKFAGTHLYTWVERGTMRVKCLAQEHNAVSRPGFEPGPPDPESSALTIRPPRLPQLNDIKMECNYIPIPLTFLIICHYFNAKLVVKEKYSTSSSSLTSLLKTFSFQFCNLPWAKRGVQPAARLGPEPYEPSAISC